MEKLPVAYVYSDRLRLQCDKLPTMRNRATIIHDLIVSCQLLDDSNLSVIKSIPATQDELKLFHSSDYVDSIKRISETQMNTEEDADELEDFGISYDCPYLEDLYDFVTEVGGSSITAANLLIEGKARVALNWFGGWHHALRDRAEGFCYVNDIVLAITKLLTKYKKILYLDLDVHHGDGVEYAFQFTNNVLTLSYHQCWPGFFPGTGNVNEVGLNRGKYYSLNVPYKEGIGDENFTALFQQTFPLVFAAFKPEVMIVQCGADVLAEDPIGHCNVTIDAMAQCVNSALKCNLPTILLGGGGYNNPNAARYWTQLTATAIDTTLPEDVPETSLFFTKYKPSYEMQICRGNRKDLNSKQHIKEVIGKIKEYCDNISVGQK